MLTSSPSRHLLRALSQLWAQVSPADQSHLHPVHWQSATVLRSWIHAHPRPDCPLVCMAFRPFPPRLLTWYRPSPSLIRLCHLFPGNTNICLAKTAEFRILGRTGVNFAQTRAQIIAFFERFLPKSTTRWRNQSRFHVRQQRFRKITGNNCKESSTTAMC